ncbi:MAG: hypothetical protein AAFZ92_01755 [Pseudomonadota bacterium]
MNYRIVFLDRATIPDHVQFRQPDCDHQWIDYGLTSADELIERAKIAHIIVTNKVVFNQAVLSQLPEMPQELDKHGCPTTQQPRAGSSLS